MANKENLRKWIDALRSGKYVQARNVLHRQTSEGESFCCLGVACKVALDNGLKLSVSLERDERGIAVRYDDTAATLPPAVAGWLGIDSDGDVRFRPTDPDRMGDKEDPVSAIGANDSCGWDFARIADKLEQHFGLVEEPVAVAA